MKTIGRQKRITFESYEDMEKAVRKKLAKLFTRYGTDSTVTNYFKFKPISDDRLRVYLYTKEHYYAIDVTTGGYLGCVYSNRKSLAGETWLRGRDLSDGSHNHKNWVRIMSDIIWCELERLSTEVLSKMELEGVDTNNPEAKELAQLRREQQSVGEKQEVEEAK